MLGQHHNVWFDPERLAPEQVAGTTKTADHLISHNEDVVLAAHFLDFFPIGFRRHNHTTRSHQRFPVEGRDGFGALFLNQIIQFLSETIRKLLLGFTRLCEPVEVRTADVEKTRKRHVKTSLVRRYPGKACADGGDAMVGIHPTDEFLFGRFAQSVVAVPQKLHNRVIGFRAGVGEKHLTHWHWR